MSPDDMTQDGSALAGGRETPKMNPNPASGVAPAADTSATTLTQPGNASVATTPNNTTPKHTTMNTNTTHNIPADDENAAIVSATATNAARAASGVLSSGTPIDSMGEGATTQSFSGDSFTIPEGGATVRAKLTVDDSGSLSVSGPSSFTISASLPDGEWTSLDDASYWQTEEEHFLSAGSYDVSGSVTVNCKTKGDKAEGKKECL